MIRSVLALGIAGLCMSCCGPERLSVPPLPVDGEPIPYADLLIRLRAHSGSANEAFFTDNFEALAARAADIERAASFLPKATDPPKTARGRLEEGAAKLASEAKALGEAAKTRNEDRIREAL